MGIEKCVARSYTATGAHFVICDLPLPPGIASEDLENLHRSAVRSRVHAAIFRSGATKDEVDGLVAWMHLRPTHNWAPAAINELYAVLGLSAWMARDALRALAYCEHAARGGSILGLCVVEAIRTGYPLDEFRQWSFDAY